MTPGQQEISGTPRAESPFAILPDAPAAVRRGASPMTDFPTATHAPQSGEEDVATAYLAYYRLLEFMATRRCHVPEEDVRGVIHDVFIAFLRNRGKICDGRAWLVGATFYQCRLYWRSRGREDMMTELGELEPSIDAADIAARVDASTILRHLPSRCRELLHLRFFEEFSSQEIARRYATTVPYARKLVHRCIVSARALFVRRHGAQP
jgi:RNA polymerase sigma factor (sigma-70 family)